MAGVLSAGQARQEMIIELLCPCGRKWSHTTNAEAIAPLKGTSPACKIRELFGCARTFRLMPTRRCRQQNSETIIQLRHPLQCAYGRATHHQQQRNHLHYLYRFLSSV